MPAILVYGLASSVKFNVVADFQDDLLEDTPQAGRPVRYVVKAVGTHADEPTALSCGPKSRSHPLLAPATNTEPENLINKTETG